MRRSVALKNLTETIRDGVKHRGQGSKMVNIIFVQSLWMDVF